MRSEWEKWMASPAVDAASKAELAPLGGDEAALEERFGRRLEFGTGGLRGVMRAGLNGMNVYTVRQATQGLASLILAGGGAERSCAVAFDTRLHSSDFAREAACVLAANGVRAYLFDGPRPTPELSFAVRELGCTAGINITASHNPKEYNGYKAYWSDGAQLPPDHADEVERRIASADIFAGVKTMPYAEAVAAGRIIPAGTALDEAFLASVLAQRIHPEAAAAGGMKIVYTPFHGAGHRLVPEVLRRAGYSDILAVREQMLLDGTFPTVKSPNPEEKEGFIRAVALARENDVDLIIGTDPDADRVGVAALDRNGEYVNLTGNQVGALLTEYVLSGLSARGALPKSAAVVKTIVTTELVEPICQAYGAALVNVLTGFKFIGEKIKEFEATGEYRYVFGFEESYGYLAGTYARDKDAVVASLLIAEMAAYHRARGMTLFDALEALYRKYGYYLEKGLSIQMPGADGLRRMAKTMETMRAACPRQIAGRKVLFFRDYLAGTVRELATGKEEPAGLPESDVLYYHMEDGARLVLRPSGTEPKIKFYMLLSGAGRADCERRAEEYEAAFRALLSAEDR